MGANEWTVIDVTPEALRSVKPGDRVLFANGGILGDRGEVERITRQSLHVRLEGPWSGAVVSVPRRQVQGVIRGSFLVSAAELDQERNRPTPN